MRLGIVKLVGEYVVDLDSPEMVQRAKDALCGDMMNAAKYDQVGAWIDVVAAPDATEDDIAVFLTAEGE